MTPELRSFIDDLYAKGREFDQAEPDWSRRWRNIDPPVGEFLWILIKAIKAKEVLELGTSNGYSTIWLADAVRDNQGKLVSVDFDKELINLAQSNLDAAGISDVVELRCCEAGSLLSDLPDMSIDALFLDAERSDYAGWWPHPERVLRRGGVLIADNMTSHPEELATLYEQIQSSGVFSTAVVPVGKGELVAVRDLG